MVDKKKPAGQYGIFKRAKKVAKIKEKLDNWDDEDTPVWTYWDDEDTPVWIDPDKTPNREDSEAIAEEMRKYGRLPKPKIEDDD